MPTNAINITRATMGEVNLINFIFIYFNIFFFRSEITEKLCDDGFVFNDYDIKVEKCDLPNNIDCSKRPNLRKLFLSDLHQPEPRDKLMCILFLSL